MSAKRFRPYQPLLLRLLHGLTGLFVILALFTAFWTYQVYDGRWLNVSMPDLKSIEGIHGTFGLYSLLIFPLFAVYAFHRGQNRLVQADSLPQLSQVGAPIWWYTLHRLANTLMLLSLTFALFSGKMMSEKWLPNGELYHTWYYAHLLSWVVLVVCLGLHLLMSAKVGGRPLLLSMLDWHFLAKDSPSLWLPQMRQWWRDRSASRLLQHWLQLSAPLRFLEAGILGSIIVAWIISSLK